LKYYYKTNNKRSCKARTLEINVKRGLQDNEIVVNSSESCFLENKSFYESGKCVPIRKCQCTMYVCVWSFINIILVWKKTAEPAKNRFIKK